MRVASASLLILLLLPALSPAGTELRQCRNAAGQTLLTDAPVCPAGSRETTVHAVQDPIEDHINPDVQAEQERALSIYDGQSGTRSSSTTHRASKGAVPRSERNAADRQECQSLVAAREAVQQRMRAGYTAAEGNALHERLRRIEAQQCALDCVYC